jgi:hypothetical protein
VHDFTNVGEQSEKTYVDAHASGRQLLCFSLHAMARPIAQVVEAVLI